jgi:hypothetical protein
MTGEYASDEAEVTLKVTLEQSGLMIHRRTDTVIPLTPTYRDGFSASVGSGDGFSASVGSVRFMRDSGGHVTEMSIGYPRMWDLRLRRIQ